MNLEDLLSKVNYYFVKTAYIKIPEELVEVVKSYVLYNMEKYLPKENNSIDIEELNSNPTENTQTTNNSTGFTDKIKNIVNKIIGNSPGTSSAQTVSPVKELPAIDWKSSLKNIQIIEESEKSVILRIPLEIMPYYNSMTEEHFNEYFANKYTSKGLTVPTNVNKFKKLKYVALKILITDSGYWEYSSSMSDLWFDDSTFFMGQIGISVKAEDNYRDVIIESVIDHELTHFMQSYITMMSGHDIKSNFFAGIPKKKDIIKNIDPEGRIINIEKNCKKCGSKILEADKNCKV